LLNLFLDMILHDYTHNLPGSS